MLKVQRQNAFFLLLVLSEKPTNIALCAANCHTVSSLYTWHEMYCHILTLERFAETSYTVNTWKTTP